MTFLTHNIAIIASTPDPQWGTIIMGLLGGLALFLLGMDMMSEALKLIAGDGLRTMLARLTKNRFTGAAAGAVVTSIIQSSSVTTVLVVGFISAGLMNLSQSIGIIMGANIGTTMTAQIIAFKVTKYALALIAGGFSMTFIFKNERVRHYGKAIMGLGLVFFGMQMMSDGTGPLRSYEPFIEFMKGMDSPLLGIAFGALFTAIVQSSSATTGIVIVLASQGFLPLPAGIALIFGANIGTCFTAWLASLGKSCEAKRAVAVHVLFNIAGVAVWFFFIPWLADIITSISPESSDLSGNEKLAADTPRQIANAHTVFNITNTLLFIGFTVPFARLVTRLIPDKPSSNRESYRPKYLDTSLLATPAMALDATRMELSRMGTVVTQITKEALGTVVHGDELSIKNLRHKDNQVDAVHSAILDYLSQLSRTNLGAKHAELLNQYLAAANYLENIADMVETNLVETGKQRLHENLIISEETQAMLKHFHSKVEQQVELAVTALVTNDHALAGEVVKAKPEIAKLSTDADAHLSRRLGADEPNRMMTFHLESELIEYLKRMYYFAKRIAKIVGSNPSTKVRRAPEES